MTCNFCVSFSGIYTTSVPCMQYFKITVVAAVATRKQTFFVFKVGDLVFSAKRIKFTLV